MIDNLKPTAIVRKPIYYGQKDLSKIGDALSTESLINRLVGNKTAEIKKAIEEKKDEIIDTRDINISLGFFSHSRACLRLVEGQPFKGCIRACTYMEAVYSA